MLDACRAAYSPHHLCAVLCPRVLELAPGRARTGLLEFLTVLVPHSASFLGNPGHLHSLTQRVAAALVQSPPPVSWDGGSGGGVRCGGGGGGGGGLGEEKGGGSSAAVAAASAATRLLSALFRLDGDALLAASGSLPPESAAAVRRALERSCGPDAVCSPAVVLLSPAGWQKQQQQRPSMVAATAAAVVVEVTGGVYGADAGDDCGAPADVVGTVVSPASARTAVVGVASDGKRRSLSPAVHVVGKESRFDSPGTAGTALASSLTGGGALSTFGGNGSSGGGSSVSCPPSPQQQAQQARRQGQHRQPLAPVTPRVNSNTMTDIAGASEAFHSDAGCENSDGRNSCFAFAPGGGCERAFAKTVPRRSSTAATQGGGSGGGGEPAEVARRLIAGLSPGARTCQKVDALSSLRGLADGEGAGARAEFWPRYFGQVLMLLLEGAAGATAGGGGRGRGRDASQSMTTSPSRRGVVLRAKHVQGVRCLVARRGGLFPESTEVVVGRLVEIGGGDPSPVVRCEAEACLADLVSVLEPSRYLAVLVPLLLSSSRARDDDDGYVEALGGGGGGGGGAAAEGGGVGSALTQCVALEALRALTSRLSSPGLLGALGSGPLLGALEGALESRDLEARKRAVLALVEMYQVSERERSRFGIVLYSMFLFVVGTVRLFCLFFGGCTRCSWDENI